MIRTLKECTPNDPCPEHRAEGERRGHAFLPAESCPRCGQNHPSLRFVPLAHPKGKEREKNGPTMYGLCPATNEPILLAAFIAPPAAAAVAESVFVDIDRAAIGDKPIAVSDIGIVNAWLERTHAMPGCNHAEAYEVGPSFGSQPRYMFHFRVQPGSPFAEHLQRLGAALPPKGMKPGVGYPVGEEAVKAAEPLRRPPHGNPEANGFLSRNDVVAAAVGSPDNDGDEADDSPKPNDTPRML